MIVGDDAALAMLADQLDADDPANAPAADGAPSAAVQAILDSAGSVKMPEGLKARFGPAGDPDVRKPEIGDWPAAVALPPGLTVASDVRTGKPLERVHILLLPCTDGAEVPA